MGSLARRVTLRSAATAAFALVCVAWPEPAPVGEARAMAFDGSGGQAAAPRPITVSDLWLVPRADVFQARSALARAVGDLADGKAAAALPVFAKGTSDPVLGGYALLFMGRAQLALGQHSDATFSARQLLTTAPRGYLLEAAQLLAADAAEASQDSANAAKALTALADEKPIPLSAATVLLRLGRAQLAGGSKTLATKAFTRLFYEFALTPEATEAEDELARLMVPGIAPTRDTYPLDLGRAERLFGARRFGDARRWFDLLRPLATAEDRVLVELRLAQCDFHLKRYPAANNALRAYLDKQTTRLLEAQYYYLGTLRELGRLDEYQTRLRAFVAENPESPFAESALNDLGTYYILGDDDGKAAEVFSEQHRRFPQGAFADRAAWKAGWWAYKQGEYKETIRLFESAAVTLRRADYRPSWLYWAAHAHLNLGERQAALAGYRQVVADYRNSYYGRQAAREIETINAAVRPAGGAPASPARRELPASIVAGTPPANAPLIQQLLAAGMYNEAIGELRRLQVDSGTSPLLEATLAYALGRRGDLRPSINTMRRAYPQFMAAGGEALPNEILTVIFPVEYWSLIYKYATDRGLDPFLMTALVAQESTFQADVRSAANAYGLMQIVPDTGRRYAQLLGIRSFRTARLTDAETNVRIGMAYFSDLLKRFGNVAPALAAYNAGEHRVVKWLAERPGADRDEFIDDIPFPETQNYVKRIIGTAEDYRLLYPHLVASSMRQSGR
jgi:peptidoglycan lytic transglycosylase